MTRIPIILTLLVYATHSCNIMVAGTTCESEDGEESLECEEACCTTNGEVKCCSGTGLWIVGIIIPIVVTVGCCFLCFCIRRRRSNNDCLYDNSCLFDNSCLCNDDCCFDANPIPSRGDHIVRDMNITPADRRVNIAMQTTFNQSSSSHPSINRPSIPDAPPYSSHPSIPDAPPKYSEVCQTAVNPPLDTQL